LPAVTFTAAADLCIDAGIQSGLGSGITGGVYSGTGVTDDGTEKLIPLILLQPVLEHIQ
jgi:hypothetical protein